MKIKSFVRLTLSLSVVFGCSTSPEGRKQIHLLPDSQMDQMGAQSFTELKQKTPLSRDPKKIAFVKCVTGLILKQIQNVDTGQWEIQVFESPEINAFALPGRKIGVYTGILEVTETGGQLAAVIGHEVGHVIANHGNERVSTALVTQLGLAGVNAALNQKNENHGTLMAALGLGAQFGILMPHSRTQESEADMIGLNLMARAGFEPSESVRLWQNMSRKSGGSPPEWLSTHPSNDTRIKQLGSRMESANQAFAASQFRDQAAKCKM